MDIHELSNYLQVSETTISSNFVRLQNRLKENHHLLLEKTGRGRQTEYYVSELKCGAIEYYNYKKRNKTEQDIDAQIKSVELKEDIERWSTKTVAIAFEVTEDVARKKLVSAWISQMK